MLKNIWTKTSSFVKTILLVIAVGCVAFFAGRHSRPAEVVTKVETVTKTVEVVKWQTETKYVDRTVTKYSNQDTLQQSKNSDCTEKFSENTGKLLERRCIDKTDTASAHAGSGSSDSSSSGSSVSSGSKDTTTDTHTKTEVTVKNDLMPTWRVGAMALVKPELNLGNPTFGVTVEHKLFWGFYLGVTAIPQANLYGISLSRGF